MSRVARGTTLDPVQAYAAAAERFVDAVAAADLRAPVAGCPGWSTYDLVVHLGNVHAWAATIVETGRKAAPHSDEPRSNGKAKIASAWYAGKAGDLYAVLRGVAPDQPCWNFVEDDGVAGFWQRRQLHETAVHLLDLEAVAGRVATIHPEVAVDGVDEVLSVLLPRSHRRHPVRLTRPVALVATDTGDTWVAAPVGPPSSLPTQPRGPGRAPAGPAPSVQHRHSPGTAVPDRVEAPAAVLYRLLWHREVADSDWSVSGDASRVRAFLGSRLIP